MQLNEELAIKADQITCAKVVSFDALIKINWIESQINLLLNEELPDYEQRIVINLIRKQIDEL
jgi:hypothetical protein